MRRVAVKVLSALAVTGCVLQLSGCNGGWVTSEITLTITPDTATEGDLTLPDAGEAAISRMCDEDLTVDLASDDETELTVPATVTIPAGETSVTFDLTVEDESDVDGTQTATVTASALGWTSGSDGIYILDDD